MNAKTRAWAEQEWVPEPVRLQQRRALGIFLVCVSAAGVLVLAGAAASWVRWPIPLSLGILGAAIVIAIGAMIVVPYVAPYRRCTEPMPDTIFHVSPALWEEGEAVTLEIARSGKNKQYVADRGRPKRTPLVFFFPQRPTIEHARGQSLKGKSRARRYLYELRPTHSVDVTYVRSSAWATPADLTVVVVHRQELEPLRGRRR